MSGRGLPRWAEVIIAGTAVVVCAPLMAGVALAILVADGRPVLFAQTRVGRGGEPFRLWKFRTMRTGGDGGAGITVAGDPRITPIGKALRRWKLDELPQLFNVLDGSMSLVGPRPELPEYVALYTDEQRRVLRYRPGLTDPATLAFRHEEALLAEQEDPEAYYRSELIPRKLAMNLEYGARRTPASDLALLWRTARSIFRPDPRRP